LYLNAAPQTHIPPLDRPGDTQGHARASERRPLVIAEKPRIVVSELGANDGLRELPLAGTPRNPKRSYRLSMK
jgi:hypothetical protein